MSPLPQRCLNGTIRKATDALGLRKRDPAGTRCFRRRRRLRCVAWASHRDGARRRGPPTHLGVSLERDNTPGPERAGLGRRPDLASRLPDELQPATARWDVRRVVLGAPIVRSGKIRMRRATAHRGDRARGHARASLRCGLVRRLGARRASPLRSGSSATDLQAYSSLCSHWRPYGGRFAPCRYRIGGLGLRRPIRSWQQVPSAGPTTRGEFCFRVKATAGPPDR